MRRKKKVKGREVGCVLARLTGVSALETFVELEGEGNVDLHHLHLRYAWRMCHYASTPAEHELVAVNRRHDHVPAQRNHTFCFNSLLRYRSTAFRDGCRQFLVHRAITVNRFKGNLVEDHISLATLQDDVLSEC